MSEQAQNEQPAELPATMTLDEVLQLHNVSPYQLNANERGMLAMAYSQVLATDNLAMTLARVGTRLDHRLMLETGHTVGEAQALRHTLTLAVDAHLRGSEVETIAGYQLAWIYLREWVRWFLRGGAVPRWPLR